MALTGAAAAAVLAVPQLPAWALRMVSSVADSCGGGEL